MDLVNIHISFGMAFGLLIFTLMGGFYGMKSTDVSGSRLLWLALASNLMSFTIFGVLFTIIWIVARIAGTDLTIAGFHIALGTMVLAGVVGFFIGYIIGKLLKPDHREVT